MVPVSEPTLTLHDRGAPRRRLDHDRPAAAVVGDRAGRPTASPRATTRRTAAPSGIDARPPRRRRRRDDRACRGRLRRAADRAGAGARSPATCCRLGAPAERRRHPVRRQGPRAPGQARPQRQPPRGADHRTAWEAGDDRRRRARPARPVHLRGDLRRAGDVRARQDPRPARSPWSPAARTRWRDPGPRRWRRASPTWTASPAATCSS